MKRLLASMALLFAISSAHASMIWRAVAVDSAQLDGLTKNEELLARTLLATKGDQAINLDKAWHGIHFLLNGTAWKVTSTAGQAVLGGREFGADMGYGPPRVVSKEDVVKVAKALSMITSKELSARYSPKIMEEEDIYPSSTWQQEGPQALKFLLDGYAELLAFYQRAAKNGSMPFRVEFDIR
ncbi:YfbM family protein [Rugamonas sp. CCM 8940]|uniref:YfbM family protein n=1 Tax=Rugamonas sp. CCM 8940 TaxID=2765359 RepID=UPI0018F29CE5|nr:YfbM family protein [Rugamonas sp. CCM 8940]MBJ7313923.1 YfbM family protein [Rugamonas sp. CCM 8940]